MPFTMHTEINKKNAFIYKNIVKYEYYIYNVYTSLVLLCVNRIKQYLRYRIIGC